MTTETSTIPADVNAAADDAVRRYVAITLTDALRDAIESRAAALGTTPGLLCRSIVADHLGVVVDVNRSAPRKYDSEEAKKNAQTAQRLNATVLKHTLMADHMEKMGNASAAAKFRKLADEASGKITALVGRVGGTMDALEAELEAAA